MGDRQRFLNKTVLIIGGNSGIGRATALAFRDEGAFVIVTGRNMATLADIEKELAHNGLAVQLDIVDIPSIERLMKSVAQIKGTIDVLFVNAGTGAFKPMAEVDEAFYDTMMATNLKGPYFAIKHALPLMGAGTAIVLTSSIGHCKGIAGNSVYAASKAGLRALARNVGVEVVDKGIRVNCFSPGAIDTPLITRGGLSEEQINGYREMICSNVPMKRFGTPEEAAAAVLFLASDDASYITGIDLFADGGLVSF